MTKITFSNKNFKKKTKKNLRKNSHFYKKSKIVNNENVKNFLHVFKNNLFLCL